MEIRGFLVDTLGLPHGALDVEGLDVLPVLLQEGDEEVDGETDVDDELLFGEVDVADGDAHAEDLLQLELDGALDVPHLLGHVFVGAEEGGEFAGLVQTGAEDTGDLTEDAFRGEEGIVAFGQFLDKFLILVELLQSLDVLGGDVELGGLIDVDLVSENAELQPRLALVGKLDGAAETLVLLGVVVLEADLKLDGLDESSLVVSGFFEEFGDRFAK